MIDGEHNLGVALVEGVVPALGLREIGGAPRRGCKGDGGGKYESNSADVHGGSPPRSRAVA